MLYKYRVNSIFIYPVKSLSGIEVDEAHAEIPGFRYDRRWMLTDQAGQFLTQRNIPAMALLKTAVVPGGISVNVPHHPMNELIIPFESDSGTRIRVKIWNDEVDALLAEKDYNNWFTEALGIPCNLVFMDDQARRPVNQKYKVRDEMVSFADGYPYMILSQESLNDLNSRLEKKIPANRFRPNIVFEGGEAFAEDSFDEFVIGQAKFKAVKPCERCKIITIDQATAIPGDEPLRELSKYRKKNNGVYFGYNALCLESGIVRKGEFIDVRYGERFTIES
jgi:uncharacterized protein YcbX